MNKEPVKAPVPTPTPTTPPVVAEIVPKVEKPVNGETKPAAAPSAPAPAPIPEKVEVPPARNVVTNNTPATPATSNNNNSTNDVKPRAVINRNVVVAEPNGTVARPASNRVVVTAESVKATSKPAKDNDSDSDLDFDEFLEQENDAKKSKRTAICSVQNSTTFFWNSSRQYKYRYLVSLFGPFHHQSFVHVVEIRYVDTTLY